MTALAYESRDAALAEDRADATIAPRAVIETAFGLLASLEGLGSARVSELQRDSGLPRTTVRRMLGQLQEVGAVERSNRRWRLGPTLIRFGAGVPADPRLRDVARRPLMDLANATGALVALTVEMAGRNVVVDVMPGTRPLAHEPTPGLVCGAEEFAALGLDPAKVATVRAHRRARHGDLRPVVDAGGGHPRISAAAAPLRISPRDVAAVLLMVPGRGGVAAPLVEATRRTAARIASQLSASALA